MARQRRKVFDTGFAILLSIMAVFFVSCSRQRADQAAAPANEPAVDETAASEAAVVAGTSEAAAPEETVAGLKGGALSPAGREIVEEREKLNETVWSDEVTAQKFEVPFIDLWDAMRASEDQIDELTRFSFEDLTISLPGEPTSHDHSIDEYRCDNGTRSFDPEQWQNWISDWKDTGLRVVQSEWHHSRFEPDDETPRSLVSFVLDLENTTDGTRYTVKGKLAVEWQPLSESSDRPQARSIEATDVTILSRQAPPVFEEAAMLETSSPNRLLLIAHDVDGDGLSELLSPVENSLFWNRGNFQFERAELFDFPPGGPGLAGVMADLTGDGVPDFLGSSPVGTVFLYTADESGRFPTKPQIVFSADDLREPTVITAGDIDADGDLDLWIGQYKPPYSGGQMPTPYFDANDGDPAYLLRNDGNGGFEDITEASGLSGKRHRRTYSASLADLDGDLDLDLVVVSDFAGIDVYTNDGTGNFTDVTDEKLDNRHAFGMSHSFADYNLDSKLDFYMVGMSSTTALRLHQMGLGQEQFQEYQEVRPEMGYGNRLYLADGPNFHQAPFNSQVARTGWSWGSTSFDFDNDGDRDIFVANGHQSQRTAKDYCTDFWCHDIYSGSSKEDEELGQFFKMSNALNFREKGISWNGFEHNKLFMNEDGKGFLGIEFLAGVASEFDSRNVISDDFNGDGRMDLVVMSRAPVSRSPSIHILQNNSDSDANWIGVRLDNPERSGLGAFVTVKTPDRTHVAAVVSGDSYISQHASVVHFGLGSATEVEEIEIRWPDGAVAKISNPEINRYHQLRSGDIVASEVASRQ